MKRIVLAAAVGAVLVWALAGTGFCQDDEEMERREQPAPALNVGDESPDQEPTDDELLSDHLKNFPLCICKTCPHCSDCMGMK